MSDLKIRASIKRFFAKRFIRLVCRSRVLLYKAFLSDASPAIKSGKVVQPTQFIGKGRILIESAQLGIWPSPGMLSGNGYIEARSRDAVVEIGPGTYINNNFTIIADKASVKIGARCLIGPNFFVCDSDFHEIDKANRLSGRHICEPVLIEDDVFIGEGVRILKGVRVGAGSVIGSGSLVVKDVEADSLYAGVPARKLKDINTM